MCCHGPTLLGFSDLRQWESPGVFWSPPWTQIVVLVGNQISTPGFTKGGAVQDRDTPCGQVWNQSCVLQSSATKLGNKHSPVGSYRATNPSLLIEHAWQGGGSGNQAFVFNETRKLEVEADV